MSRGREVQRWFFHTSFALDKGSFRYVFHRPLGGFGAQFKQGRTSRFESRDVAIFVIGLSAKPQPVLDRVSERTCQAVSAVLSVDDFLGLF